METWVFKNVDVRRIVRELRKWHYLGLIDLDKIGEREYNDSSIVWEKSVTIPEECETWLKKFNPTIYSNSIEELRERAII